MKILRNRKGAIFIVVVMFSFLMVFISVATSNMLLQDVHMMRHLKYSTQALLLAEAGASEALAVLANASVWSTGTGSGSLGGGSYSYTIDQIGARWRVMSVGTVSGVSRTVSLEVKNAFPLVMNNIVSANNDIDIKAVQDDVTVKGDMHANNDMKLDGNPKDIDVVAYGAATGRVTAVNSFDIKNDVYIEGGTAFGTVLPPVNFDFAYFKGIADGTGVPGGGDVGVFYSGDTDFTTDGENLNGGDAGITYVAGKATFKADDVTITGGFVAVGDIEIKNNRDVTQSHDAGNRFPIFMSNASMTINGNFKTEEGNIVYAQNDVKMMSDGADAAVVGCVIAGNTLTVNAKNHLTFTYGSITAPEVVPSGMVVVSWNK